MDPALVILLVRILAEQGPKIYFAAKKLLAKTTVTMADFDELDALLDKSGASYFQK